MTVIVQDDHITAGAWAAYVNIYNLNSVNLKLFSFEP